MKLKSNRIVIACRLDERYGQELRARAEKLNTTVCDLVEEYVIAGLRESGYQEKITGIPQKTETFWLD